MVKRGRLSAADKAQRMALIHGTLDYGDLAGADVIIEAALERMDLKKIVFAELDRVAKPGAVLATNTSTLDIDEIATATTRPQDVIGLHFFSPANVMPLLEVVRTGKTSAECVATAMELARPLRKTPVLARVCYGFIGNRMMEGYAREAQRMVLEGATPRRVDSVLERFGMAMGILAVFDMAGIDVGVNVHRANADRYPPDPTYYQADVALHAAGRLGQKTAKGYYRYEPGDRTRHDDPEAIALLRATAARLGVPPREHSDAEILERCLYPLINEGIRILDEGIAMRGGDVDVVWTSGYGFPRYRGGPLFHADSIGLATVLDGIMKYRAAVRSAALGAVAAAHASGERGAYARAVGCRTPLKRRTLMNVKDLVAIDVHTHAEVSCRQPVDEVWKEYEDAASRYFKAGKRPTIAETVAYYREQRIGLVMFTVDSEHEIGARRIPNQEVIDAARENSDIMLAFASIDPHKGKLGVREARQLIAEGGIARIQVPSDVPGLLSERPHGVPALRGHRRAPPACHLPQRAFRHRHGHAAAAAACASSTRTRSTSTTSRRISPT